VSYKIDSYVVVQES